MARLALIPAVAVSLTAALPAAAAPVAEPVVSHMTVAYGDLNLTKASDARKLVARIRIAAREMCGPDVAGDIGRTMDRVKCIRDAETAAVRAVNRPAVTAAYHGDRQPGPVVQADASR